MNKRGDWIQIFMFLFFFLILMITLALLFIEKDNLDSERPEMWHDFSFQKSNAVLASFLRQPIEVVDFNADGVFDTATIADLIVLNAEGKYDDVLQRLVEEITPPDHSIELVITYPGRKFKANQLVSARDILDNGYLTETTLPNNVRVTFWYADPKTRTIREELRDQGRSIKSGGAY